LLQRNHKNFPEDDLISSSIVHSQITYRQIVRLVTHLTRVVERHQLTA